MLQFKLKINYYGIKLHTLQYILKKFLVAIN